MSKRQSDEVNTDGENCNITPLLILKSSSTSQTSHRLPGDVRFGLGVVELIDVRPIVVAICLCVSSLWAIPRIMTGLSTMTDFTNEVGTPVLEVSFQRASEAIGVLHVVWVARSSIKERSCLSQGDSSCGCLLAQHAGRRDRQVDDHH